MPGVGCCLQCVQPTKWFDHKCTECGREIHQACGILVNHRLICATCNDPTSSGTRSTRRCHTRSRSNAASAETAETLPKKINKAPKPSSSSEQEEEEQEEDPEEDPEKDAEEDPEEEEKEVNPKTAATELSPSSSSSTSSSPDYPAENNAMHHLVKCASGAECMDKDNPDFCIYDSNIPNFKREAFFCSTCNKHLHFWCGVPYGLLPDGVTTAMICFKCLTTSTPESLPCLPAGEKQRKVWVERFDYVRGQMKGIMDGYKNDNNIEAIYDLVASAVSFQKEEQLRNQKKPGIQPESQAIMNKKTAAPKPAKQAKASKSLKKPPPTNQEPKAFSNEPEETVTQQPAKSQSKEANATESLGTKKPQPTSQKPNPKKKKEKDETKKIQLKCPPKILQQIHIGDGVAFWAEETEHDNRKWLADLRPEQKQEIDGKWYLIGTIMGLTKKSKTKYDVQWEAPLLDNSSLDITFLYPAIELYKSLKEKIPGVNKESYPVSPQLEEMLTRIVSGDEEGTPIESDDEDDDNLFSECLVRQRRPKDTLGDTDFAQLNFPSLEEAMKETTHFAEDDSLVWTYGGHVPSPQIPEKRTSILKDKERLFRTPLASLFCFFPIELWKIIVNRTNEHAAFTKEKNEKFIWPHNTNLKEMMQFFRILLLMTLHPTPGRSYDFPASWKRYEGIMSLQRFKSLRAALHFSPRADDPATKQSKDVLQKIRILLNTLKHTLPKYLSPGTDLSLDESSIAARSKYGRDLIFFNPQKPTGKYHFRLYLLCEADYYNCLRIIVHTKNGSDTADGYQGTFNRNDKVPVRRLVTGETTCTSKQTTSLELGINDDSDDEEELAMSERAKVVNNEVRYTKTTRLILDICDNLNNQSHVVNMDNYYTSPEALIALKHKGIYARGTTKINRKHFPRSVVISEDEARERSRGTVKYAVNHEHGLVAFGWNDNKAVHMLSSADGDNMSQVFRRVGRNKTKFDSPLAVTKYCHGMQAVDRLDQLMSLFALAQRHPFKRWYKKFAMALFDYGLTNAEIHYFMANPAKKKDRCHRYFFRKDLCDEIGSTDWSQFEPTHVDNNKALRLMNKDDEPVDSDDEFQKSKTTQVPLCTFIDLSAIESTNRRRNSTKDGPSSGQPTHAGKACQICRFEGRKDKTKKVFCCGQHRVRACIGKAPDNYPKGLKKIIDSSAQEELQWLCPDRALSCWDKAHSFYIPKGLFGDPGDLEVDREDRNRHISVRAKPTAKLRKLKDEWEILKGFRDGTRRRPGPKRGSKNQIKRKAETGSSKRAVKRNRKSDLGEGRWVLRKPHESAADDAEVGEKKPTKKQSDSLNEDSSSEESGGKENDGSSSSGSEGSDSDLEDVGKSVSKVTAV